jgi:PhoH-like ATPase
MVMTKNFVLDTNVLLHDSGCLQAFADNTVNIPIFVIEELDTFKRDQTELGRNARAISREIDRLRLLGNLRDGVAMESGGVLRVILDRASLPDGFSVQHSMDDAILSSALWVRQQAPDTQLIFVSKDTNLRIRADALGLVAEDYDKQGREVSELYAGTAELEVSAELIDALYQQGSFGREELLALGVLDTLYPNQYLYLRGAEAAGKTAYGRVVGTRIEHVNRGKAGVWGVQPRNREQVFALDMLLRDDIQLCTLVGKAGTGKTLLAIAAGLQSVMDSDLYRKLLVSRPIFPMGKDVGYLPGDLQAKLGPWMQPIHDNIDFLTGANAGKGAKVWNYDELVEEGILEVEALTYIRGRSLPKVFIVVDEAQNLTPHEVKTVLTRVGEGTKVILTGDPAQIDQPYLDSINNGLTYAAERFKNESIAAHVTLTKGERSPLAELAANLL